MNTVYMVVGNRIAFMEGCYRPNGLFNHCPVSQLVTPKGVVIPCSHAWSTLHRYMKKGTIIEGTIDSQWHGAIVEPDGELVDYYYDNDDGSYYPQPIVVGEGIKVCRSNRVSGEESAYGCLKLTETLEEAVALYCKSNCIPTKLFKLYELTELGKLVKGA